MDKSREQFEEEFRKYSTLDKDDIFKIDSESNDYYYLATRQAWFWWQASRESLEVELPNANPDDSGSPNFYDGYNTAISDIYDESISIGVKIKNGTL